MCPGVSKEKQKYFSDSVAGSEFRWTVAMETHYPNL